MKPHYLTAGLVVRGGLRKFLLQNGIRFQEDKGWIESDFYLDCTEEVYKWVCDCIQAWVNANTPTTPAPSKEEQNLKE